MTTEVKPVTELVTDELIRYAEYFGQPLFLAYAVRVSLELKDRGLLRDETQLNNVARIISEWRTELNVTDSPYDDREKALIALNRIAELVGNG